jgi:hypothetical protein
MKKENDIQRDICHYLRKRGLLFWRFSPETYNAKLGIHIKSEWIPNGLPDIMVIDPEDGFIGLEVKKPTKSKISAHQLLMQKRFRLANARYEFVRSVEDVKALGL